MAEYLLSLMTRLEALEKGVFSHPPSDWEEFQRRLGRYQELRYLIDQINGIIEENDSEV